MPKPLQASEASLSAQLTKSLHMACILEFLYDCLELCFKFVMINYHFLSSSLSYSMRLQTFWDQAQWSSHRVWGLPGGKGSLWKNIFRWLNSPRLKGCPWEPRLFKKVYLHKPNHQHLCSSWAAPVLNESPKLASAIHDILSVLSPQPHLLTD